MQAKRQAILLRPSLWRLMTTFFALPSLVATADGQTAIGQTRSHHADCVIALVRLAQSSRREVLQCTELVNEILQGLGRGCAPVSKLGILRWNGDKDDIPSDQLGLPSGQWRTLKYRLFGMAQLALSLMLLLDWMHRADWSQLLSRIAKAEVIKCVFSITAEHIAQSWPAGSFRHVLPTVLTADTELVAANAATSKSHMQSCQPLSSAFNRRWAPYRSQVLR